MKHLFTSKITPIYFVLCFISCLSCATEEGVEEAQSQRVEEEIEGDQYLSSSRCEVNYILEGDECVINVQLDTDFDGIPNAVDNCVDISNAQQEDCDRDGQGNACDTEQACGGFMTGYVQRFNLGEQTPVPYAYTHLEVEGVPTLTQSDELGQYQLRNLPLGTHRLFIYSPPAHTGHTQNTQEVIEATYNKTPIGVFEFEITPNDINTPITRDWLIKPAGNFAGKVILGEGDPLTPLHGDVGVYIEELPYTRLLSQNSGRFLFEAIPEGEYTLKFAKEGYELFSVPIEVIGLTTQYLNDTLGALNLSAQLEPQTWRHDIEVLIEEPLENLGSLEIVLEPIFPHQTTGQTLRVSEHEVRDEGVVFFVRGVEHNLHDVFDVKVTQKEIEGSRRTNISPTEEELTSTVLRARGLSVNPFVSLDTDHDGISDDEDEDRDNDGCINSKDDEPTDPFICRSEPDNGDFIDIDSTPIESPYQMINADYGEWTMTVEGDLADSVVVNHASRRVPFFHLLPQSALTIVHPHIYTFTFPENTTDLSSQLHLRATLPFYSEDITLIALNTECPVNEYSRANSDFPDIFGQIMGMSELCQPIQTSLSECESSSTSEVICNATLTLNHQREISSYRVWIYEEVEIVREEANSYSCEQCVNGHNSINFSLYGLLRRHYLERLNEVSCNRSAFIGPHREPDESCFPNDENGCIPKQLIGNFGTPMVVVQLQFEREDLFNLGMLMQLDIVPNILADHPILSILGLHTVTLIRYQISDGYTYTNLEFELDPTGLNDQYCWGL